MSETNAGTIAAPGSITGDISQLGSLVTEALASATTAETAVAGVTSMFTKAENWFEHGISAIKLGAATVYHDVVAIETDVTEWKQDHPEIWQLVEKGLTYAVSLLTRTQVPVAALSLVAEDVLAALKQMGAADATLPSKN